MATESEFYPKDDHSWKTWMFQEYLQVRGPLTEENVLEYFEESFVFDRSSNNNVLRMQTQHADPNYRMSRFEMETELKRFVGKEYALVHSQPPLFVIQYRERLSPTEVRSLAVYFILNNVLYSAPDIYTLLATKLTNALNMIQSSLDTLRAARPDYTPRIGHVWPIVDNPSPNKLTKIPGGTRQGSVAPGASGDTLMGSSKEEVGNKPPQEKADEEKQVWEPFAFAFHFTRLEMDRRRAAAALEANARGAAAVAGGVEGDGASTSGAARRIRGLSVPPATTSDGQTSAGRVNVPTADAPSGKKDKEKGTPGPAGRPGDGKKKRRRAANNAAKAAAAQPPTPSAK